jgi:hypothetical protein
MNHRLMLAKLIEDAVAAKITPREATNALNSLDLPWKSDNDLANAWHALHHFEIDQDLFSKDPAYADAQIRALLRIARDLRLTTRE